MLSCRLVSFGMIPENESRKGGPLAWLISGLQGSRCKLSSAPAPKGVPGEQLQLIRSPQAETIHPLPSNRYEAFRSPTLGLLPSSASLLAFQQQPWHPVTTSTRLSVSLFPCSIVVSSRALRLKWGRPVNSKRVANRLLAYRPRIEASSCQLESARYAAVRQRHRSQGQRAVVHL